MLPGPTELIIILVIVLVIFGAGKLPKVMGDMGRGVRSFKKAMDDENLMDDTTIEKKAADSDTNNKKSA